MEEFAFEAIWRRKQATAAWQLLFIFGVFYA